MINRGDIKLAIDMVVNAQDDNLFGGEAEYVINTLEDCGNTIAAQAAVIEKLREALSDTLWFLERYSNRWDGINGKHPNCVVETAREALTIPTDSTQILAEVRRAERERCAKVCEAFSDDDDAMDRQVKVQCAEAILALE